jgi:hypothetical protein
VFVCFFFYLSGGGGGELQFRRPKAASLPQELEIKAAGSRANFYIVLKYLLPNT